MALKSWRLRRNTFLYRIETIVTVLGGHIALRYTVSQEGDATVLVLKPTTYVSSFDSAEEDLAGKC